MISVLAASNVFVGTSMHGNITAFSFGIPHLFGPINFSKIDGFLDITELDSDLKIDEWRNLGDKLDWLSQFDRDYFIDRATNAKQHVNTTFQSLVSAIKD